MGSESCVLPLLPWQPLKKSPQSESLDSATSSSLPVSPSSYRRPAPVASRGERVEGRPWISPYWDSEPVLTCPVALRMNIQSSEKFSNWPKAAQQMHRQVGIGAQVLLTESGSFVGPGYAEQRVIPAEPLPCPARARESPASLP